MVKGVCDYVDSQKDDTYYDFAARASALYGLSFIQTYVTQELLPPRPPDEKHPKFLNVPRRIPLFTGREAFLQNLHETLNVDKSIILTYAPKAISGMGGIGKTQAAIEYAYRYRHDYETVLWVKADTTADILSSFMDIANRLGLLEKREQSPQRVVAAVKQWLEAHTKWLLIFDSADKLKVLPDFLPQTLEQGQHILLTTRDRAAGQIRATLVEIDIMTEDEGSLFLLRRARKLADTASLDDASGDDRSDARKIVQELRGLPLALEQAGAYIASTIISMKEYLDRYQTYRLGLLKRSNDKLPDYTHTIATVWSVSFQRVNEANPAATELLRLCAFLDPDAIPEEIIAGGTQTLGPVLGPLSSEELRMDEIRGELLRFSLIRRNSSTKTLTIHSLIQAVIRDNMDEEMRRTWAERAIRTVNHAFPKKVNDVKTWPQCQRYLPHAVACAELIKDYELVSLEAAQLLNQVSYYLREQARFREAEEYFLQALATSEKLGSEHLLYKAQILNNLARLYFDQYQYTKAEPIYEQALAIREQELGPEDPVIAQNLNSLALNYWYEGKYEKAEPLYQRALSISEQKLGPEHAQTLFILNNMALLYRSQGKYEEAIKLNRQVLKIREEKFGHVHLEIAQSLNNLAVTYYEQGNESKYGEAELLFKRALEIREQLLPSEHPQIARVLDFLGSLYEVQDKDEEAEQCFERALGIYERSLGSDNLQTIGTKQKNAALLRKMKRDEEAAILEAQIKAMQASKSSED